MLLVNNKLFKAKEIVSHFLGREGAKLKEDEKKME
jgi:hypothetical protein